MGAANPRRCFLPTIARATRATSRLLRVDKCVGLVPWLPRPQAGVVIPDAYPRLILDAIRGDQQHFVRRWAGWAMCVCVCLCEVVVERRRGPLDDAQGKNILMGIQTR